MKKVHVRKFDLEEKNMNCFDDIKPYFDMSIDYNHYQANAMEIIAKVENYCNDEVTSVAIVEDVDIPDYGCFNLKGFDKLVIKEGCKSIGPNAFSNADFEFVDVEYTVKYIYDRAFMNCKNMKQIIMPSDLNYIGKYAFANCESLECIVFPENVKMVDENAFIGCTNLKHVVLHRSCTIFDNTFKDCPSLTKFTYICDDKSNDECDSSDTPLREFEIFVRDNEEKLNMGSRIHNQLKGKKEYIDNDIILNIDEENRINITAFTEDAVDIISKLNIK